MSKAKLVAFTSIMVALSIIFEILPLKVRTPWGMNIDLVAVPIIALYLLLGFRAGFFGLITMTIALFIISGPNTMGIGPIMKFFATLSVLIGLEISGRITNKFGVGYLIIAFILGSIIRDVLMILLNYYFALPLFLKMLGYSISSRSDVIRIVEEMTKTPFWLAIALPNTIQTGVDIFVASPVIKRLKVEER
ncbi:ECF transporter S component [Pyrococcus horikoshii]|uniref:ECF transporter S component n=2 Tax=Pyrococcus horikoshii TaxID=53953 RepID=O57989_PYRHO|nr:ECF transporter S component [Pyrococcus horikoshii]BAA29323.1 191aa long hypothetical protein [Pyrococcus horikoshii OT3]HII61158.1 ECF transporter S component [Pyrococcus horikoshii]